MTAAEHLFRNKKASAGGGINTQALADELAIKARQAHSVEMAADNSVNGLRNHEIALRDLDQGKFDIPSLDENSFISDIFNAKNYNSSESLLILRQSIRENTTRKPIVYAVEDLPDELLKKINSGRDFESFNAETKRVLEDSGLVKNGVIDYEMTNGKIGSNQTTKDFLKTHNKNAYSRQFKKNSKLPRDAKKPFAKAINDEPLVKNEIDIAVEKAIVDSPFIAPIREEFNPQEIVAPVEKATASQDAEIERIADLKLSAFEGMVERDPEAFVVIDGNATRVADILETVREFDNHINAFKTCGIL
jgi:hypothetical protein